MSGITIKCKRGQKVDVALRRLKRKMLKEGIFDEIKKRKYFEKPSEKRQKQRNAQKFNNKLRTKNNKL